MSGIQLTPGEIAAILSSSLSLLVSLVTFRVSVAQHSDKQTAEQIRQLYLDMISLHDLRAAHPLQSHLFEIGPQYSEVKLTVASIRNKEPEVALVQLRLEERAIARRVFSMYESSFYQWRNAKTRRDRARFFFLKDVLDYFTTRLLTNPRLAWYWSEDGGGLCVHYEKLTREYYQRNVKVINKDATGPLDA